MNNEELAKRLFHAPKDKCKYCDAKLQWEFSMEDGDGKWYRKLCPQCGWVYEVACVLREASRNEGAI